MLMSETVGLIGAGNIAHVHVAAWKALGARAVSVCSR